MPVVLPVYQKPLVIPCVCNVPPLRALLQSPPKSCEFDLMNVTPSLRKQRCPEDVPNRTLEID